jgi:tetratricopeptide (TPR) repeat protein
LPFFRSPYVELNQRGEAIRLWEQLTQHSDNSAAAEASKMLELHLPLFIQEVHATLQRLAVKHTWTLRHLGESTKLTLQDFTTKLLHEAIETRDHGQAKLSLELIEAALSAALTSPWLADNQARALVHLHRLPEAVAIWEELSQLEDSHIRETAQKMVKHFGPEAARQTVFQQADTLLVEGDIDGAVQLLESPGSRLPDENLLLAMAKRLRKNNQAAASLTLLNAACKQNEQGSAWLRDSRAHSLWLLNRRLEALEIWEQLQHHPDPAVASAAKARLRPPTQQPLWLCYLDGEIDTSVHSADPITCGVRGWILHTTHTRWLEAANPLGYLPTAGSRSSLCARLPLEPNHPFGRGLHTCRCPSGPMAGAADQPENPWPSCAPRFQERCHSWAATQAASINGNSRASSCSSGGLLIHTSSGWSQQRVFRLQRVGLAWRAAS